MSYMHKKHVTFRRFWAVLRSRKAEIGIVVGLTSLFLGLTNFFVGSGNANNIAQIRNELEAIKGDVAGSKILALESMALAASLEGVSYVYSTNEQHTPFDEPFKVTVNDQVCAVVYDPDGDVKSDSCQ